VPQIPNGERVKEALLAENRQDHETFLAALHRDVEWRTERNPFGFPDLMRGHDEILAAARAAHERTGGLKLTIHEVTERGALVLAVGALHGGREIGNLPRAWIFTMRDGRAIRVQSFGSIPEARRIFGLAADRR
jgi:ketosteroid isomerase-like protein